MRFFMEASYCLADVWPTSLVVGVYFVSGLLLFTCASLLGGLATSGGVLIAARGAQGLGAALLSPAAFSLLTTTFAEGPTRNRALGIWGTLAAVGVMTGVLLGGILTASLGWLWIFFLNVPLGFLVAIFAMLWLQESRSAAVKREIDWIGAVMVTSGLIALVYAVVGTNVGGAPLHFLSGAIALLLLAAFVVLEARIRAPLVPLHLLRRRSLIVTNSIFLLQGMAAGASAFIMTLYLQEVLNYSALQTGLAFLPLGIAGVIGGPIAFQLVSRLGVKRTAIFGLFAELVALILLSRVSVQSHFLFDVLPGLGLFGLGIVLSLIALTIETAAGVNDADQGLVGGLFTTSQQVGTGLGLAITTAVAIARTLALGGFSERQHLVGGFQLAFAVAAGFAFLGCLVAFCIPSHVPHR